MNLAEQQKARAASPLARDPQLQRRVTQVLLRYGGLRLGEVQRALAGSVATTQLRVCLSHLHARGLITQGDDGRYRLSPARV